jgi:hypothetical protein
MDPMYGGIRIVEDPYLPEGFICIQDRNGMSVLNLKTGYVSNRAPEGGGFWFSQCETT